MGHRCYCDLPGHCPWHNEIVERTDLVDCRNGILKQTESKPCVYLGREVAGDPGTYECSRYERCTIDSHVNGVPSCSRCDSHLFIENGLSEFQDPLLVTDRRRSPTVALRDMLAGGAAFLVCGGPSLKQIDMSALSRRGVFSLGVNNVAGMAPVNAFVCSDPPLKFHNGIFQDPSIMKFLPLPKMNGSRAKMRHKIGDKFYWLDKQVGDCPNVWGFQRRSWMMPDQTFFTDQAAAWGNLDEGLRRFGQPKTACTMLIALRLLYYLGARTVFLLGCDFRMNPLLPLDGNYAFSENRDEDAIRSNNDQFRIIQEWLTELMPWFLRFGFKVYNCSESSSLRAFPFIEFDRAMDITLREFPSEPLDLNGWYCKSTE